MCQDKLEEGDRLFTKYGDKENKKRELHVAFINDLKTNQKKAFVAISKRNLRDQKILENIRWAKVIHWDLEGQPQRLNDLDLKGENQEGQKFDVKQNDREIVFVCSKEVGKSLGTILLYYAIAYIHQEFPDARIWMNIISQTLSNSWLKRLKKTLMAFHI